MELKIARRGEHFFVEEVRHPDAWGGFRTWSKKLENLDEAIVFAKSQLMPEYDEFVIRTPDESKDGFSYYASNSEYPRSMGGGGLALDDVLERARKALGGR